MTKHEEITARLDLIKVLESVKIEAEVFYADNVYDKKEFLLTTSCDSSKLNYSIINFYRQGASDSGKLADAIKSINDHIAATFAPLINDEKEMIKKLL